MHNPYFLKFLLYSALSLFTVIQLQAQIDVDVIYEYSDYTTIYNNKNTGQVYDMAYAANGDVVLVGGIPVPFIIRVDTNGDEIYRRAYADIFLPLGSGTEASGAFTSVQIDKEGFIWVNGWSDETDVFVLKLNQQGDTVCLFNEEGSSHSESPNLEIQDSQFYLDDEYAYLIARKYEGEWALNLEEKIYLYTFEYKDGCLEKISERDILEISPNYDPGFFANQRPKVNGAWICDGGPIIQFNKNGVFEIDDNSDWSKPNNLARANRLGEFYYWGGNMFDSHLGIRKYVIGKTNSNLEIVQEKEFLVDNMPPSVDTRMHLQFVEVTDSNGIIASASRLEDNEWETMLLQLDYDLNIIDTSWFDYNQKDMSIQTLTNGDLTIARQFTGGYYDGVSLHKFHFDKIIPEVPFHSSSPTISETVTSLIYPNPNSQEQLRLLSELSIEKVNIYGINGSLVYSKQIARPSYSLSLSTLQSGVYIVELRLSNGNTNFHKLVRQ